MCRVAVKPYCTIPYHTIPIITVPYRTTPSIYNNRTGFDLASDRPYLVQFAPLRRRVSGDGGELQAKLIQRYAVFPQCSCSCSTHHSHLAVATYDPAIISISITPAAGKADLVPACMFTLQHVDCVVCRNRYACGH